ncbi:MAG TPA: hypothetical protein VFZ14_00490 [Burkholderiales bacterium]|nr:hypothetical protein [Burkholderiales bacterium]
MRYAILILAFFAHAASAELPAPTPEQKAAEQKKKAAEAAELKEQKQALEKTQARIAQQYHAQHPDRPRGMSPGEIQEPVGKSDVPKSAKQPPGKQAKPHEGGRGSPQSEAHTQSSH